MSTLGNNWLRTLKNEHAKRRAKKALKNRRLDRRPLLEKFEDRAAAGSMLLTLPGWFGEGESAPPFEPALRDPLADLLRPATGQSPTVGISNVSAGSSLNLPPVGSSVPAHGGDPGEAARPGRNAEPDAGFTQHVSSQPTELGGFQFDTLLPPLVDAFGAGEEGETMTRQSPAPGGGSGGSSGGGGGGGGGGGSGMASGAEGESSTGSATVSPTSAADAGGLANPGGSGAGSAATDALGSAGPSETSPATSNGDAAQGSPAPAEASAPVQTAAPATSSANAGRSRRAPIRRLGRRRSTRPLLPRAQPPPKSMRSSRPPRVDRGLRY